MNQRMWILTGIFVYLIGLWVFHRLRKARRRRRGLTPQRLASFDHRGLLDELEDVYEAGLPASDDAEATATAAEEGSPVYSGPLVEQLGARPPSWFAARRWHSSAAAPDLAEPLQRARMLLEEGREAEVLALIDPAQDTALDQGFASLGVHHFLSRLYSSDLDGAALVLARLPSWTRNRIPAKLVDKHLAEIALLRAEIDAPRRRQHIREARRLIRRAGGGGRYADSGTRALWAHLTLTFGRNLVLEEPILFWVDYSLRRALSEDLSSSLLYYELAHCCLWRERPEEAIDHLARALYFGSNGPFYAAPLLGWAELARLKPALVQQARARARIMDVTAELHSRSP